MELTRKSVYPVHKLDAISGDSTMDDTSNEGTDTVDDNVDYRIKAHYLELM